MVLMNGKEVFGSTDESMYVLAAPEDITSKATVLRVKGLGGEKIGRGYGP